MLAFVKDLQQYYSYVESNNDWKEANFGGNEIISGNGVPIYTKE
jgi:hypothetical protein